MRWKWIEYITRIGYCIAGKRKKQTEKIKGTEKMNNSYQRNCNGSDFVKGYDYNNRIYYCDHEDRVDDMGKLGVGFLPKASPEWCPLRENN